MRQDRDDGSFTLIFYRMDPNRRREPLLNRLAAWATASEFTHVEIAIGSASGSEVRSTNNDAHAPTYTRACALLHPVLRAK